VKGKECTHMAQDCAQSCHVTHATPPERGAFGRDGVLVTRWLLREKGERAQAGAVGVE
jgi:hypothetical protein